MVLMISAAFAAPTTNNTLTINDSRTGKTYVAYQILVGDISGSEGEVGAAGYTLSNIAWGNGVSAVGGTAVTAGTLLTAAEIAALPSATSTHAQIETYIESLTKVTANGITSSAKDGGGYQITGLTSGWYVVYETTQLADGSNDYVSAFLTEVVGNASANPIGAIRSEYPVSVEELGGIKRFQPLGENREQETDSFRKDLGPLLTES